LPKKLTEEQKKEIVEGFTMGKTIEELSKEFNFTSLTIQRNIKKNLGEKKYKNLIDLHKIDNKNLNNEINDKKNNSNKFLSQNKEVKSNFKQFIDEKDSVKEIENSENEFVEIAPLDYVIDNTQRKELSSLPIANVDFPKILYMIVDHKIELEVKLLKDYPDWQFLPEHDLNRKTIEVFSDLKVAKRFCSKDQKVIKVPNTNVLKITSRFLINRGISRIISSDQLISL